MCGKKLTIGVEHRVEELADRPAGFRPEEAKPFESLAPLPEVIAASTGGSAAGKKTLEQYERLLQTLGPEFTILRDVPIEDICSGQRAPAWRRASGACGWGRWSAVPGLTGNTVPSPSLTPAEIQRPERTGLPVWGRGDPKTGGEKAGTAPKAAEGGGAGGEQGLQRSNSQQQAAISAEERTVAVVAGPGTGKTKTLVDRIAWLVEERGVRPGEITAVTFTNQAAAEMRQRLEERLGRRAASRMTIGTFHAICLALLGDVGLIGQGEALSLAEETLRVLGRKGSARALLQAVSQVKNGASLETAGLEEEIWQAYCARLEERGMLDFDDLLIRALALDTGGPDLLPAPAGRRVPGHQRDPVPAGPGLERQRSPLCHRRPGPVYLRFPRGGRELFPAAAGGTAGAAGDPAGGELPLHAGDAGGCRPRDREKSGRLPPPAPQPALRPGGTDGAGARMPSLRGSFSPRRSAV